MAWSAGRLGSAGFATVTSTSPARARSSGGIDAVSSRLLAAIVGSSRSPKWITSPGVKPVPSTASPALPSGCR